MGAPWLFWWLAHRLNGDSEELGFREIGVKAIGSLCPSDQIGTGLQRHSRGCIGRHNRGAVGRISVRKNSEGCYSASAAKLDFGRAGYDEWAFILVKIPTCASPKVEVGSFRYGRERNQFRGLEWTDGEAVSPLT